MSKKGIKYTSNLYVIVCVHMSMRMRDCACACKRAKVIESRIYMDF